MAAGYWMAGKTSETASFELFVRRLPPNRDFLVVCGLEQAIEYLTGLRFLSREIAYLKTLPQLEQAPAGFWDYLQDFRFTGDLFAVPEGTVMFPGEPMLTVQAPLIEAQIPETYLLSTIGFQTVIASKAARIVNAAAGRAVVEFGCRRAHAPEAGCLAGRAAFLAGCAGTSNVEAGMRFAVPVFGTAAHSWVLSFGNETLAFRKLQELLGERTVQLIDTYDTLEGARNATSIGKPLWGVRLDSGDLLQLSLDVRKILDDAGFTETKIMATNDLDEHTIAELVRRGAAIDVFGVGTSLATSFDAPALSAVYKLVQIESNGQTRYASKHSEGTRILSSTVNTLYLDIDTQLDFVFPSGSLYVPGAEKILAHVAALNHEAISGGHTLLATMDAHTENDPEFQSWPHHCVAGSLGQRKPAQTLVPGIHILEKQNVNCFTNPKLDEFLRQGAFGKAIVYGVVTEICVLHAANGLLQRGIQVEVRTHAIKELNAKAAASFFEALRAQGGVVV